MGRTFYWDKIYFDELAAGVSDGASHDDGKHWDTSDTDTGMTLGVALSVEQYVTNEVLTLSLNLAFDSDENYAKYIDLLPLVPEKFRSSLALQQFLLVAGENVGTWLGLINDLEAIIDKYRASDEELPYLAALIGLEFITDGDTTTAEKRKQLVEAIDWFKMKGTYPSLANIAYLTGFPMTLKDMYTLDYETFVSVPWYAGDIGTLPPELDPELAYYKTPHLGLHLDLNIERGTSPDTYLYQSSSLDIISSYVERVRPINVVPHYVLSLSPQLDSSGAVTTQPGNIRSALFGGWSNIRSYFDNASHFDSGFYFDASDSAALSAIVKWKLGTGSRNTSPGDSSFTDLENVVLQGDIDSLTIYPTYADYKIILDTDTIQDGISELGLYLSNNTTLRIASTFPPIDMDGRVSLEIIVRFYYS